MMARKETYLTIYLCAVLARRIFLGAYLMVDVSNSFQSRFHVTEYPSLRVRWSELPSYSSNSQTSVKIDLNKAITLPI